MVLVDIPTSPPAAVVIGIPSKLLGIDVVNNNSLFLCYVLHPCLCGKKGQGRFKDSLQHLRKMYVTDFSYKTGQMAKLIGFAVAIG